MVHAEFGRLGSVCTLQDVTQLVQSALPRATQLSFEWLKPWPPWATLLVVVAPSPFGLRRVVDPQLHMSQLRVLAVRAGQAQHKWTPDEIASESTPMDSHFSAQHQHAIFQRARAMHQLHTPSGHVLDVRGQRSQLARLTSVMAVSQFATHLKVRACLWFAVLFFEGWLGSTNLQFTLIVWLCVCVYVWLRACVRVCGCVCVCFFTLFFALSFSPFRASQPEKTKTKTKTKKFRSASARSR